MTPSQLWASSPQVFNEWRRDNDLPRLLLFFKANLPYFDVWMNKYGITDDIFYSAPHTGKWFLNASELMFVEYTENGITKFIICEDFELEFAFKSKHLDINIVNKIYFFPYLTWGPGKVGKKDFILIDHLNDTYSNTLTYNSWDSTNAYLFKSYPVLQLGNITLQTGVDISQRNLDFVNLDNITITGEFHGSHQTEINFSSCRNMKLNNTKLHHYNFRNSYVTDINISNSSIQDFLFNNCFLHHFTCSQSSINGLEVYGSKYFIPLIERTEVQRFSYTPDLKFIKYDQLSDTYRRLKNIFQSIGKRAETQQYYYLEKCYERKTYWEPYKYFRSEFPKNHSLNIVNTFKSWKKKNITTKDTLGNIISRIGFYFKVWLIPQYLINRIKYMTKYLLSMISFLVWGYGQSYLRVIGFALFIILVYAVTYLSIGPTEDKIIDSVYFSIVTFTTLGYGDIQPSNETLKLLCSSEALLGAITMGLIIGTLSRKTDF